MKQLCNFSTELVEGSSPVVLPTTQFDEFLLEHAGASIALPAGMKDFRLNSWSLHDDKLGFLAVHRGFGMAAEHISCNCDHPELS